MNTGKISSYEFIVLGAGGAGRTAAAIVSLTGRQNIAFLDDKVTNGFVNGFEVAGNISNRMAFQHSSYVIAFGSRFQAERVALFNSMAEEGFAFFNAIFPGTYIDTTATLGMGNVLAAGVKILPNAQVGNNCFMCVTSSVDHDSKVEDGVYLAPGATLCGGVHIEEGAFIGANATVLPEVRVGKYAVVGAGAVVAQDVPPAAIVVGVPARQREKHFMGAL